MRAAKIVLLFEERYFDNKRSFRNDWIERLQAFDPRRVVFAHDGAVWEP
jgi:hypothetical protein